MNKILVHLQGGEKSGSIDESARHAITKLAHLHFPATKKAAENIINMGENKNVYNLMPLNRINKKYKSENSGLGFSKCGSWKKLTLIKI